MIPFLLTLFACEPEDKWLYTWREPPGLACLQSSYLPYDPYHWRFAEDPVDDGGYWVKPHVSVEGVCYHIDFVCKARHEDCDPFATDPLFGGGDLTCPDGTMDCCANDYLYNLPDCGLGSIDPP